MPEQAVGAKRLLVPEDFWLFLYKDAISVKPDDPLGCPTFPLDSRECSQCSDELSEEACLEDSLRSLLYILYFYNSDVENFEVNFVFMMQISKTNAAPKS